MFKITCLRKEECGRAPPYSGTNTTAQKGDDESVADKLQEEGDGNENTLVHSREEQGAMKERGRGPAERGVWLIPGSIGYYRHHGVTKGIPLPDCGQSTRMNHRIGGCAPPPTGRKREKVRRENDIVCSFKNEGII